MQQFLEWLAEKLANFFNIDRDGTMYDEPETFYDEDEDDSV